MNGIGTLFSQNVVVYNGEWKDGKRNGKGTQYLIDGDKYEGEWKEDHM